MTISSQTRQAGPFTGNGATTAFPFAFKVFTAADLVVVRTDLSGADSTLVLGTDYSVTLNADQNANPGGTITLPVALATGFKLTATSGLENLQPTDLTNQGGFYPAVINNALDRLTILVQQLANGLARSIKFPISDGTDGDTTMPGKDLRKGRVLAFHETTGNPVQGPSVADVGTVAANVASINTVSTNIASVNTVSTNIASVNTTAGSIASVNTVAANIADVIVVADNVTNFAGVYYGGSTSDPATRRDGSPLQPGDLYFNTTTNRLRVFNATTGTWNEGNAGSVAVQNFNGTGSQTAFTLAAAPESENNTQVYISGVYQQKDQYSISGATLTFTSAPPAGTSNIEVVTLNTLPLGVTSADLVQFVQAGTGAVSRTAQSKMWESVSVEDFGAVGDGNGTGGGTDNTAAFAAAIATGKAIYIPEGIYRIDNPVVLESAPAGSLCLFGAHGVHTGTQNGKTVIDLTNNTQYFIAVGYAPLFEDIVFKGGVNVIHYNTSGLDASTCRLVNVRALQWTGTFFHMFTAGNGSMITWDRPVLISNNDSAVVFDNTGLVNTTDSLYINDGWIETRSTVGFKCKVGRIGLVGTRFIPYTNSISPNDSLWFDCYTAAHFSAINTDFGGESKRQIINWRENGGEIHLVQVGLTSFDAIKAINLVGAPLIIRIDDVHISGSSGGTRLIQIDPTMSATSLALLSRCRLTLDGNPENVELQLLDINSSAVGFALAARLTRPEVEAILRVDDLVAFTGPAWNTSSGGSGFSVISGASASDSLGSDGQGYRYTATADVTEAFRYMNDGPGVSTLTEGAYTYEAIVGITGDSARVGLLFGSGATSSAQRKTFYLAPGIHHICFPLYITTGMTKNIGFELSMKNGTVINMSRMRVFKGFYHKRKWDVYASATPASVTLPWVRGDRVINSVPAVGQPVAWTCSAYGAPATWRSEGSL